MRAISGGWSCQSCHMLLATDWVNGRPVAVACHTTGCKYHGIFYEVPSIELNELKPPDELGRDSKSE